MYTYYIAIPICGIWNAALESDEKLTDDEAVNKALEECVPDPTGQDVTWEALREVVSGNIFHGPLDEARVESVESDEEED